MIKLKEKQVENVEKQHEEIIVDPETKLEIKNNMKDLDEIVKYNIKEINKIKKYYIDNKSNNIQTENKHLRDQFKKLEEKFYNDIKEFKLIKEDAQSSANTKKEFINPEKKAANINQKFKDNFNKIVNSISLIPNNHNINSSNVVSFNSNTFNNNNHHKDNKDKVNVNMNVNHKENTESVSSLAFIKDYENIFNNTNFVIKKYTLTYLNYY